MDSHHEKVKDIKQRLWQFIWDNHADLMKLKRAKASKEKRLQLKQSMGVKY